MSHDRGPPRIPPPSSTSPAEYGSALAATDPPYPFPTTGYYQHSPATEAAIATANAGSGAANMRDTSSLSPVERWALRASDSQFNAIAGAVGGFTSGVVTCPLDVIKTKLQAQGGFAPVQKGRHAGHHKVYEGLVGTAKVIWREEGVRGMYRGLGPIILGYLPTWAVWFTVYNKSKEYVGQFQGELFLGYVADVGLVTD
jgi:solute carrier family 25 (mitochondrial folate transporter), member 32